MPKIDYNNPRDSKSNSRKLKSSKLTNLVNNEFFKKVTNKYDSDNIYRFDNDQVNSLLFNNSNNTNNKNDNKTNNIKKNTVSFQKSNNSFYSDQSKKSKKSKKYNDENDDCIDELVDDVPNLKKLNSTHFFKNYRNKRFSVVAPTIIKNIDSNNTVFDNIKYSIYEFEINPETVLPKSLHKRCHSLKCFSNKLNLKIINCKEKTSNLIRKNFKEVNPLYKTANGMMQIKSDLNFTHNANGIVNMLRNTEFINEDPPEKNERHVNRLPTNNSIQSELSFKTFNSYNSEEESHHRSVARLDSHLTHVNPLTNANEFKIRKSGVIPQYSSFHPKNTNEKKFLEDNPIIGLQLGIFAPSNYHSNSPRKMESLNLRGTRQLKKRYSTKKLKLINLKEKYKKSVSNMPCNKHKNEDGEVENLESYENKNSKENKEIIVSNNNKENKHRKESKENNIVNSKDKSKENKPCPIIKTDENMNDVRKIHSHEVKSAADKLTPNCKEFTINFFKNQEVEDNSIYPKISSIISKLTTIRIVFIILILVLVFNIFVVELFTDKSYAVEFELDVLETYLKTGQVDYFKKILHNFIERKEMFNTTDNKEVIEFGFVNYKKMCSFNLCNEEHEIKEYHYSTDNTTNYTIVYHDDHLAHEIRHYDKLLFKSRDQVLYAILNFFPEHKYIYIFHLCSYIFSFLMLFVFSLYTLFDI